MHRHRRGLRHQHRAIAALDVHALVRAQDRARQRRQIGQARRRRSCAAGRRRAGQQQHRPGARAVAAGLMASVLAGPAARRASGVRAARPGAALGPCAAERCPRLVLGAPRAAAPIRRCWYLHSALVLVGAVGQRQARRIAGQEALAAQPLRGLASPVPGHYADRCQLLLMDCSSRCPSSPRAMAAATA